MAQNAFSGGVASSRQQSRRSVLEPWSSLPVKHLEKSDRAVRADETVSANERSLKLIIDTIPAITWSTEPDGFCDFVSRRWLEFTGLSAAETLGFGWATALHPDDAPGLLEYWKTALNSCGPAEYEARMRRFDGVYRWFLFRASPLLDETGEVIKWYGTNVDIDDRISAEEKLKEAYLRLTQAQQLSKTGSFISDLTLDEHEFSDEALRIYEFDPTAKVTVQMVRDIVHADDLSSFDSAIERAMAGMDVDFVFRIVTARGVKHVRGIARLLKRIAGRPLFVGALQDVTETKAAEAALSKARSDLAHVARMTTLSTLTASIAHEVNQPLSGVITNAGTCLRILEAASPNLDRAREAASRIIRDANRASDVIARLRALFSKKNLTLEPVDLDEAMREVIALSRSDFERNRVVLQSEFADDLPTITGDRVQLQQVILNLLRNACEAMDNVHDRPKIVSIKTESVDERGVRLSVRDAGVGIDPQNLDQVFDAFYTTKKDGMGVGLSVSRSIIEGHHGRLWAEPNDGPGATFSFFIPFDPNCFSGAVPAVGNL